MNMADISSTNKGEDMSLSMTIALIALLLDLQCLTETLREYGEELRKERKEWQQMHCRK